MRKNESTERFKNLKELMLHLIEGGVITNLDDSCPECGVFLDQDGTLQWVIEGEDEEQRPTYVADLSFGNKQATQFRPLPINLMIKALRK